MVITDTLVLAASNHSEITVSLCLPPTVCLLVLIVRRESEPL